MIINRRRIWYWVSGLLFLGSVVVIVGWGLPLAIDFTGGNLAEVTSERSADEIRQQLANQQVAATVQPSGDHYLIRFTPPTGTDLAARDLLTAAIGEQGSISRFAAVGPAVSRTLQAKAFWSVGLASIAIIIYLAWAFRAVAFVISPWTFGVIAVIALLHDLVIMTGVFSLLGHLVPAISLDVYFITALLTIMGYSVNDTIVIFDRVRENLRRQSADFEAAVEKSVLATLGRSLNTSLAVLLVILPLLFLGGGPLLSFLTALSVGVVVGTYSSIFIAAPLLVTWQGWRRRRQM